MGKFGKEFKSLHIQEWKENYINYKSLKTFIRSSVEMISTGESDCIEKNKEFPHIQKIENPPDSSPNEGIDFEEKAGSTEIPVLKIEPIKKRTILTEFIETLDKEIKKIYLFFVNKERDLYVQINSHLHLRQTYDTFNLRAIAKEFEELTKISNVCFNITKYINDNMTALKKILKKFDRKFKQLYGEISYAFIQSKLEAKNSDLLYILQFKIIDEVGALLEDLMNDLKLKYEMRKWDNFPSNPSEETLIQGSEEDRLGIKDSELKVFISGNIQDLTSNLFMIDEYYQNFKNNFKEWNSYLKQSIKATSKVFSVTKDTSLCGESIVFAKESGYAQINQEGGMNLEIRRDSVDSTIFFSKENGSNIYITLFHTFFFMFSYSVVIPSNKDYVKMLGYDYYYSGFIMCLTPLGSLISLLYTRIWTTRSFRQPILISTLLMLIGNILYAIAGSVDSIVALAVGRLVLGLGSNRVANRGYLLSFIPKRKLSRYLLYYQICSLTGLATGPLVAIPILYINDFWHGTNLANGYTNPSWFSAIISLIILIFVLTSYAEPLNESFNIYSEDVSASGPTSRSASFAENLSKKDSNMIEELNERLSEINEQNKFSDTNLVSKSIDEIAYREKQSMGYTCKSFLVFISILFVVRLTIEALMIISPYYVNELVPSFDSKFVALLIGLSLFLVIPLGMGYDKYLSTKLKDRKIIICLLLCCILFNALILNLWYHSIIQYCIMFVCLIVTSAFLENIATGIFSKIIPSDYEFWGVGGGLVIQAFTTSARVLGAMMLTIAGKVSSDNLNRIAYGISLFLFLAVLVLNIFFYSELRVKAIARILRGKATRKLKPAEF